MSKPNPPSPARRSFLTRFNRAAGSLAAITVGSSAFAQVRTTPAARWEPARHEKDDWMDQAAGKHRLIFDTTTEPGLRNANLYTGNYIRVNRTEYGVENTDLAIILVLRHESTGFGFNEAMWAKYGTPISARSGFVDPKTKAPATSNVHLATLDSLGKQGIQFAVCAMATRALAGLIAPAVGGTADAIFTELTGNLIGQARMVPAGIVAVNRAQERGYSLVTT